MFWKGIVTELLWFLRGDTNIKYLIDNGVNIWNEDAYNYYLKVFKDFYRTTPAVCLTFENFIKEIKADTPKKGYYPDYALGDCGYQYGKVWREWEIFDTGITIVRDDKPSKLVIDQIKNLIEGLKNNPESRRHIVTAIDPAHDKDLALYWCHAMFQFNCRPLLEQEKTKWLWDNDGLEIDTPGDHMSSNPFSTFKKKEGIVIPKYYLDCQLYQRSADAVLGVPFNIASYALLTHIIAKICNMIPGDLIVSYGDLHIYDNHKDAVKEQLNRTPGKLPSLKLSEDINWENAPDDMKGLNGLDIGHFRLEGYNPQPAIKAELSTGLNKK